MREETQLRVILEILSTYSHQELLSKHLKRFFNKYRQSGSRDRRIIKQFIFNFFRTGHAFASFTTEERLALSNYLCSHDNSSLQQHLATKTNLSLPDIEKDLSEKITTIHSVKPDFQIESVFPLHEHISSAINKNEFIKSFLKQPKVWIRVKKQFLEETERELSAKNFRYQKKSVESDQKELRSLCLSVDNASNLEEFETFKSGYFEIQDWASQQTIHYIPVDENEFWWDACAASGGKSLMMLQEEPSLKIFATDIRETVLKNLVQRFRKSGIKKFVTSREDITTLPENFVLPFPNLDGIIADVPCSGSGTWARTPDWIDRFELSSFDKFCGLQRKIVENLTKFLPPGKPLIYITCSVFKEENEENIEYFKSHLPLILQNSAYFEGASLGADTMFVAVFNKKKLSQ